MPEMVAPRALVFRPLVKGNEALGTRLEVNRKKIWEKMSVHSRGFRARVDLFRGQGIFEWQSTNKGLITILLTAWPLSLDTLVTRE